jgi:hypothetical protein
MTEPTSSKCNSTSQSVILSTERSSPGRKISFNPPAGEVHRKEQGKPWRIEHDQRISLGNAKAEEEQAEKRRWGLAKQVQDGLMHKYGINYGVSELSNLIREGINIKKQGREDLNPTEIAYVQLLAASEKYDLKQLAVLIEKFPKGR